MVNFQRLINTLIRRCGWTEKEIAAHCGMSQGNVSRIKLNPGAQPRHDIGEKLIKLHAREMKNR